MRQIDLVLLATVVADVLGPVSLGSQGDVTAITIPASAIEISVSSAPSVSSGATAKGLNSTAASGG